MQVLVAMSGGVDSSVAAAILRDEGHEVVGVTLRLWGGESDSGCCSVSDVDDARRVAQQLDIEHLVFNYADQFERDVVGPYVDAHRIGVTPNPCIECNRHLKFDALLRRAEALGFDAVATGHHARVVEVDGAARLARGADRAKDQSYVIHMLDERSLRRVLLPVGTMHKDEVRRRAGALGLRTADKPDSQDVCFISHTGGGRRTFLGSRIELRPGRLVDGSGDDLGSVDAVELVTVGQRKGLGIGIDGRPRYALDVDTESGIVRVGTVDELDDDGVTLGSVTWVDADARGRAMRAGVTAQTSAHGEPIEVREITTSSTDGATVRLVWDAPRRRVAAGQSVVLYDGEIVLGGGIVTR